MRNVIYGCLSLPQMVPVSPDCSAGGWVLLHEGDSKSYVMMVPPANPPLVDEWVVKVHMPCKHKQ